MRRVPAALVALALCASVPGRAAAETSDHQRLSVRRPESVAVSLDLDLALASPRAGFLEGGLALGLGLDVGGWLEVGLSLPLQACVELGGASRRASRLTLAPGRGNLGLGLGFYAGPWRFSCNADLGYKPVFEESPASVTCGLGLGAMRFLDPLALGANISVGTSFTCGEAPGPSPASLPLSLSLGLLALEALNSDASFVIQLGQSLSSSGHGRRGDDAWDYSASLGFRFNIARGRWGLRLGVEGPGQPVFQSGASFTWRPGDSPAPSS